MKILFGIIFPLVLAAPASALDIWVWTNEDITQNMHVVSVHDDHPCGSTSQIRIEAFPGPDAISKSGFERVVEYSGDKIVNQWTTPIDKYVVAVESDSIYILFKDKALRLHLDGSFEHVEASTYDSPSYLEHCPDLITSVFSGSDFVRCLEYRDLENGTMRTIAYEGPCT